jgi:hypothetical protein
MRTVDKKMASQDSGFKTIRKANGDEVTLKRKSSPTTFADEQPFDKANTPFPGRSEELDQYRQKKVRIANLKENIKEIEAEIEFLKDYTGTGFEASSPKHSPTSPKHSPTSPKYELTSPKDEPISDE